MKKILGVIAASFLAFGLTSCDGLDKLLRVNIFAPFAKVNLSADKIADMSVDELATLAESPSFYEDLTGGDEDAVEARTAVLAKVDEVLDSGSATPGDKQEAALLGANVVLETTPAADLVNNLANELPNMGSYDLVTETGVSAFVNALLPPAVEPLGPDTKAAFVDMVNGLAAADAYFDALGNALDPATGYVDPNANAGAIAQSALVAAVVGGIVPPVGYPGTLGDYVFSLVQDPTGTPAPAACPDLTALAGPDQPLGNILAVAGLDIQALGVN